MGAEAGGARHENGQKEEQNTEYEGGGAYGMGRGG